MQRHTCKQCGKYVQDWPMIRRGTEFCCESCEEIWEALEMEAHRFMTEAGFDERD